MVRGNRGAKFLILSVLHCASAVFNAHMLPSTMLNIVLFILMGSLWSILGCDQRVVGGRSDYYRLRDSIGGYLRNYNKIMRKLLIGFTLRTRIRLCEDRVY